MSAVDSSSLLCAAPVLTWCLDGYTDEDHTRRQQVVLNSFPFQVGRKSGLPLTLQCRTVSKVHAEFVQQDGGLWLRDLQSTNGTFVNGQRIQNRASLKPDDLVQFADLEFRLICHETEDARNTICATASHLVSSVLQFRRLMETGDILPHFQPVVRMATGSVLGYEVLARSNYQGLENAYDLFLAATRLSQEAELSELSRREGLRLGQALPDNPTLFVNTHPAEIGRSSLRTSLREIRERQYSTPVVLEIHERSACDIAAMRELKAELGDLGMRLAYDDFGNGQSRLVELMEVPPDFVKFDMGLVREIHAAPAQKQKTLETLVRMVRDLNIAPLAEGIECREESAVCAEMGFLFAQGYLFGKPEQAATILAQHVEQSFGAPASQPPVLDGRISPWDAREFRLSPTNP